jgi:pilus assembly protein FimV
VAARPVVAEAASSASSSSSAPASSSGGESAAASTQARDRSKPAPLPSVHEAEKGAPGEIKAAGQAQRIAGVWVGADGKVLKSAPREEPAEVPVRVAQALLPLAPLPLPKGVRRPQASCAPTGMSAKECVALDNHNAELSSKLLELEGKMKVLQGALGGTAAAAISVAPPPAKAAVHGGAPVTAGSALVPAAAAASVPVPAASAGAHGGEGKAAGPVSTPAASAASMPAASAASASASAPAAAEHGASAQAGAAASAASVASGPVKQVRVLPKLKYKKEKPPEAQTDYTLPLAIGGIGLLALLGAAYFWWRKKKSGHGPLQIWQGFRKKKPPEPAADAPAPAAATAPAAEASESVAS